MMEKLRVFFGFFRLSNLRQEVGRMGYKLTYTSIMLALLAFVFAGFIAGVLLHLDWMYCVVLVLVLIVCLPSMIIANVKTNYERTRFDNTVFYMEQLIYAFHKTHKIRDAIVDVWEVSITDIKRVCGRMLTFLDYNMHSINLYEDTLAIMQREYNCSRMELLHNYLIEVEYNGGDSSKSLNLLLEDIRGWAERVLLYQQERRNVKTKITISIFAAMLSCGIMINLIPTEYVTQIVSLPIYQFLTLLILCGCIILYVVASNKVGVSYLDYETDALTTEKAVNAMYYIHNFHRKNHIKPAIIKCTMFVPLIAIAIWREMYWACVPIGILMVMLASHDWMYKNTCVRRVVREVNKMFPAWIRTIVLYLQTDNVHVSIKKSIKTAPAVLKGEIERFAENLSKDPDSMRPYQEVLKDFDTPQLKMSVHYLYSIAQFGSGDMLAQLDYLVEQNSKLTLAEEKIRNEDSLAGFAMVILAPMVLAVMKLMVDLILFLNIFVGYMSAAGQV